MRQLNWIQDKLGYNMSDISIPTISLVPGRATAGVQLRGTMPWSSLLADHGIKAWAKGTTTSEAFKIAKSIGGRIPVVVASSQLELARLTIEDARADAAELDWDQVEVGDRVDRLPMKKVPTRMPRWLQGVAIGGLILMGITILGFIAWTTNWLG